MREFRYGHAKKLVQNALQLLTRALNQYLSNECRPQYVALKHYFLAHKVSPLIRAQFEECLERLLQAQTTFDARLCYGFNPSKDYQPMIQVLREILIAEQDLHKRIEHSRQLAPALAHYQRISKGGILD